MLDVTVFISYILETSYDRRRLIRKHNKQTNKETCATDTEIVAIKIDLIFFVDTYFVNA